MKIAMPKNVALFKTEHPMTPFLPQQEAAADNLSSLSAGLRLVTQQDGQKRTVDLD
jgi:hypothetical protein